MSTPRLLCIRGFAAAGKRPLSNHLLRGVQVVTRCQSTKPSATKGGFRAGRFAAYTLTTSGLMLGGALAYASYDPIFKKQADDIIPGFAQLVDTAAGLFVNRIGSTNHQGDAPSKSRDGSSRVDIGKVGEVETGWKSKKKTVTKDDNIVVVESESKIETNQSQSKEDRSINKLDKEVLTIDTVETLGAHEPEEKEMVMETNLGQETVEIVEEDGVRVTDKEVADGVVVVSGEEVESVVSSDVEKVVKEVKDEVEKVAGEVRVEKMREAQEAQMADQQLNWLKDSAQVEKQLEQTLEDFVSHTTKLEEAQNSLLEGNREHFQLLREVTGDVTAVGEDLQSLYDTADALRKAEETVEASFLALNVAQSHHKEIYHNLNDLLGRAMELGLKSKAAEVEEKVRECMGRILEGSNAMQQAEVDRELLTDYHRQAQKDREKLQNELGQELPEGDSRQEALLVMLERRVEVLKQKLNGLEKEHQERLTTALDRQKVNLEKLAEGRLQWRLRDKEREMEQELSYRCDKIHREHQSELREQFKRQTDSHNRVLTDALNTQAEQLAGKWSHVLELKLIEQESHYQKELALILSRLRGIEYMVNTIAAAGNETKRQQGMRAACDSLQTALKSASACLNPGERYSLQREVHDLREAAKDDPFVLVILNSLPTHVLSSNGIQGDGGLKERFSKVKQICRRVALVPERGGGMGTYALSYLQSVLIVSWRFVGRVAGSGELEDEDIDKLDTFNILERADTCLRQGDMELAVRYVNLLRGAPRKVARDWLCDARSYLETLQAIHLVSEYMAALNITASSSATPTV